MDEKKEIKINPDLFKSKGQSKTKKKEIVAAALEGEPKYGCLKHGKKPTYRQVNNDPAEKITIGGEVDARDARETRRERREKTIKHYAAFGKKNNTMRVLIKDAAYYKKLKKETDKLEREPLKVVREYLIKHNLHKAGSAAPEELLRETYKNAYLAGDVENTDSDLLLHNYMNAEPN
jgi:hypothetical protein